MNDLYSVQVFVEAARRYGITTAHLSQWTSQYGDRWINVSGFHSYNGRRCEESKSWAGGDYDEAKRLLVEAGMRVVEEKGIT